jgi:hypothetical protein
MESAVDAAVFLEASPEDLLRACRCLGQEEGKCRLTKVCLAFTCNDERGHAHRPGLARHVQVERNEFSFLDYQDCEAVCPNFVAAA